MFYVYQITEFPVKRFVTIKELTIGQTKLMKNVAYWSKKKHAKSWENKVKQKYPYAELKEACLVVL